MTAGITDPRRHPRVLELAEKLATARTRAKEAEREAAEADRLASEMSSAAEEAEVLAEIGEGPKGAATAARRKATEAAEAAAQATHAATTRQNAVDALARVLTEAERHARLEAETLFRDKTQSLITELSKRLRAAAAVNEQLIELMEARPAGSRGTTLAWEDLRVTPDARVGIKRRDHWRPIRGPIRRPHEGVLQWEHEAKEQGYSL